MSCIIFSDEPYFWGSHWGQIDIHIKQGLGRAIVQAVSRRLPTAAARVQTRVWSCGILWWTKVAVGQVFSENFGFLCQSTFHLLLHNHLHYHPRLAQYARSGRSANSLTNQKKIKNLGITPVRYHPKLQLLDNYQFKPPTANVHLAKYMK
jgi:hypothetical protein